MNTDFEKLMASKSDESLQEYLTHRSTFLPQVVEAAIAELQKRGRIFSDQALGGFQQEFQERKKRSEEFQQQEKITAQQATGFWPLRRWLWPLSRWNRNVVKDETAPLFYSEWAIHGFTILFNTLLGAVLLAINFHQTATKKGAWEVLTFGTIFTGLQIWLLYKIPLRELHSLPLLCNCIGSCCLKYLFWNRYIGKDTKYRKKPIWTPLIIAVMACVVVLTLIFAGELL